MLANFEAKLIKDYSFTIPLWDETKVLVANFATGKAWVGNKNDLTDGLNEAEENHGLQEATPILTQISEIQRNQLSNELHFVLIPTYSCNMRCFYCYEGPLTSTFDKQSWSKADIPAIIETIKKIINQYQGNKQKAPTITLTGGEPFQKKNIDVILSLLDQLKSLNVKEIEAISNGLELKSYVKELAAGGLRSVQITVDGPREMHDQRRKSKIPNESSYNKIIESIHAALSNGIAINCRINVDQRNIDSMPLLLKEFASSGLLAHKDFKPYIYPLSYDFYNKYSYISEDQIAQKLSLMAKKDPAMCSINWGLHGLDFFYTLFSGQKYVPKLRFCGANSNQFVLDCRGDLYTCWFGIGNSTTKIGEWNTQSISIHKENLRAWRERGTDTIEKCKTCMFSMICGAGCAFKALEENGNISAPRCVDFISVFNHCVPALFHNIQYLNKTNGHQQS